MITAAIFDLDNCLAPTKEFEESLFVPAFDAIRRANVGSHSEQELQLAFSDCLVHALDWVAARHGFTDEMLEAAWQVMATLEVNGTLRGYGDLHVLTTLPLRRYLVTSGFRCLQLSKIRALGIENAFEQVFVDALDDPRRKGKRGIFQDILNSLGSEPNDVLVVGDNPESEILAGNELGMVTLQLLRPGVPRSSRALWHVRTLSDIGPLLEEHRVLLSGLAPHGASKG
jgi:HAD superfamily hydrolase (TIGR01549 family)